MPSLVSAVRLSSCVYIPVKGCGLSCRISLEDQHFIKPAEIPRLFLSGEFWSVIVFRMIHCCGPAPQCCGTHPALLLLPLALLKALQLMSLSKERPWNKREGWHIAQKTDSSKFTGKEKYDTNQWNNRGVCKNMLTSIWEKKIFFSNYVGLYTLLHKLVIECHMSISNWN